MRPTTLPTKPNRHLKYTINRYADHEDRKRQKAAVLHLSSIVGGRSSNTDTRREWGDVNIDEFVVLRQSVVQNGQCSRRRRLTMLQRIRYDMLLYLWSKCAAVIGSNHVTWCKLIWGIDRFTGSPVSMGRHLGNIPATSGNKPHYWPGCQSLFA